MNPPLFRAVHHVALICSDLERSRAFYRDTLGFRVIREVYRQSRDSWKIDLEVGNGVQLELFSFPDPPPRPSRPEACGLRHLSFAVGDIGACLAMLADRGVAAEPVRVDEFTGSRFTFFADPDGLPIEIYEVTDASVPVGAG
jgi:glyoxylase I family protein